MADVNDLQLWATSTKENFRQYPDPILLTSFVVPV